MVRLTICTAVISMSLVGCSQGVDFNGLAAPILSSVSEDTPIVESREPEKNPVTVAPISEEASKPVAYGLWEFDNVLGADPLVCHGQESWYDGLGCQIATTACLSGKARATKIFGVFAPLNGASTGVPMATQKQIAELAGHLGVEKSFLDKFLIRYWEYHCE